MRRMWDIHQTRVYFVASVAKVIHDELTQVMPTLLQKLLPKANVKLLSFFISILLKSIVNTCHWFRELFPMMF